MLSLQHDFYNTIFKIKHKLYIDSGAVPSPHQGKILSACLAKGMKFSGMYDVMNM
jgi:hypothetical protein